MIYVLRVFTGREEKTKHMIESVVSVGSFAHIYIPVRVRQKKYQGTWHEVRESLVPGYLFVETDEPIKLHDELKNVLALTKFLGLDGPDIIELPDEDVRWLRKVLGVPEEAPKKQTFINSEAGLTLVDVSESGEVTILEGPLKGMEGQIKKFDLHKRQAELELNFLGNKTRIFMGIRLNTE